MYTHLGERAGAAAGVSESLAESWENRVSVRTSKLDLASYYDKAIPDYPPSMVPFRDDPRYQRLDTDTRRRVLAAAWVAYNEKTISVEKAVVEPACELLLRGAFAGVDTIALKRTIAQTLVDEEFHVLMCLDACLVAREMHGIETLRFPKPFVVEELEREIARCARPRDAEIVRLAFATVAEVTINAYLDLLANDHTIQPLNREITALHRKDESSHRRLFNEFTRALFPRLDDGERVAYLQSLAAGLEAFIRIDLGGWAAIVEQLDIPDADAMLQRLEASAPRRVFRDFSGFRQLLRDIGVREMDVPFRFDTTA